MSLRRLKIAMAAFAACCMTACAGPGYIPMPGPDVSFYKSDADEQPVKLAVQEIGKGKPIILLHGLGASSYSWHQIAPQLAKTHRVIAIDLKGFGNSDKPYDDRYTIFDQAKLVQDYIVKKKLRGVTLVGHSFGGGVALATSLMQLDRGGRAIERLVLIDSIAYRQPLPFFFRIMQTPVIGEIGLALIPPEIQISRALSVAYYDDWKVNDETVTQYASPLHTEEGRYALSQTINQLEPDKAETIARRYKELKTPALLIWCRHDKIVPIKYGKRLAQDLPNARLEIIPNCGHIPHEEQPSATLAAIERFTTP